jgi:MFS family permease
MQILIIFVTSVTVNTLSVVLVGLTFGPMFPAAVNMIGDIYPAEQKLIGMAIL